MILSDPEVQAALQQDLEDYKRTQALSPSTWLDSFTGNQGPQMAYRNADAVIARKYRSQGDDMGYNVGWDGEVQKQNHPMLTAGLIAAGMLAPGIGQAISGMGGGGAGAAGLGAEGAFSMGTGAGIGADVGGELAGSLLAGGGAAGSGVAAGLAGVEGGGFGLPASAVAGLPSSGIASEVGGAFDAAGNFAGPSSVSGLNGASKTSSIMNRLLHRGDGSDFGIDDAAKLLGSFAQSGASNRSFGAGLQQNSDRLALQGQSDYDRFRLQGQSDYDSLRQKALEDKFNQDIQAATNNRTAESDAWKKLLHTSYILGGGQKNFPQVSPFQGSGLGAPEPGMVQGANTLQGQLLARLAPGGNLQPPDQFVPSPMFQPTPMFKPTPVSQFSSPGVGENIANYGALGLTGLGVANKIFDWF